MARSPATITSHNLLAIASQPVPSRLGAAMCTFGKNNNAFFNKVHATLAHFGKLTKINLGHHNCKIFQ